MSVKVTVKDKDHGWVVMFKRLREAKDGRVKVGVLADDSKGSADHGGLTVAELATVLHFGTDDGHIPPRPFLSMAFDEQREELAELGSKLMAAVVVDGKMDAPKALGLMGAKLATEAKKVITTGDRLEANAPSTVAAKGSSRPLVDTGRLLNAITWAIDDKHR